MSKKCTNKRKCRISKPSNFSFNTEKCSYKCTNKSKEFLEMFRCRMHITHFVSYCGPVHTLEFSISIGGIIRSLDPDFGLTKQTSGITIIIIALEILPKKRRKTKKKRQKPTKKLENNYEKPKQNKKCHYYYLIITVDNSSYPRNI